MSTEDIAVVGLACNAGRCLVVVRGARDGSEAWRREGRGGRGGRCSGASCSSACSEASLSRSTVIASLVPFSDAAGTVGFDSVVACARSLVEVQVEAEDIAGSGEPIRLGRRWCCYWNLQWHWCRHCLSQNVINVVDGHGIGSLGESCGSAGGRANHWSASSGPPRCRVRLQENTIAGNQLCMKQHHLRPHPLDRYWTTLMN
jgi:hypothetical protein